MRRRGNLDLTVVVTSTYDEDGFLEWSVAPVGFDDDGPGTTIPAEAHHPYGFQGRPNDADNPGHVDPDGSKVLVFSEGSVQHTMALDDPRVNAKLPQLPKGGSRQYDASGARAEFDGGGNWTLDLSTSGGTGKIKVGGGIEIDVSATGVQIKGISTAAPCLVGDKATTQPTNAVLCGSPANPSQAPSTVLFASIV